MLGTSLFKTCSSPSINGMIGSYTPSKRLHTPQKKDSREDVRAQQLSSDAMIIPDSLVIRFTNDYNINHIDKMIKVKLMREFNNTPELRKNIEALKDSIAQAHTTVEVKDIRMKIAEATKTLEDIQSKRRISRYRELSKPLLHEYNGISHHTKIVDIAQVQDNDSHFPDDNDRRRIRVIEEYLKMAKEFMQIEVCPQSPITLSCSMCLFCGEELDAYMFQADKSQSCPNCGIVKTGTSGMMLGDGCYEASSHKQYQDINNFKKAFGRFMGKQKVTFDVDKLCTVLDSHFQSKGMKPASYYNSLPHLSNGKKAGTSLSILIDALKDTGNSPHYEDANLIGHKLWGWELPDLGYLEDIIMNDYKLTQDVYDSIPEDERERKSSLSTQFRLFKHLQLRGYDCSAKDFKLPCHAGSMRIHNNLWMIMCEGANRIDPSIYFIPT